MASIFFFQGGSPVGHLVYHGYVTFSAAQIKQYLQGLVQFVVLNKVLHFYCGCHLDVWNACFHWLYLFLQVEMGLTGYCVYVSINRDAGIDEDALIKLFFGIIGDLFVLHEVPT